MAQAKNPFSAVGAAAELQRRPGKVREAIEKAEGRKSKTKPNRKSRRKDKTTTLGEARRTKHVGSEGETAYGQRMTPRPTKRKARFKQKGSN